MADTIEDIARKAKRDLDSDINLQVVGQFVSEEITSLYAKTKYKALRRLGELFIPAGLGGQTNALGVPNPGGTVTVTIGSNIVTGDVTAAALWNNTLAGQFFRVFPLKTWYRIARCDPPTLTLENQYVNENNAQFAPGSPIAGQSYWIVQRYIPAAPDARYFGQFCLDYLMQPLDFLSPERMQQRYPSRWLVGPYPWVVSEFQGNLSQTFQPKMLEFYPAASLNTIVHYTYWASPPKIDFYDPIPVTLDEHIPRRLAHTCIMRYEMARAARKGQMEQAAFWRNEYRAQETVARELIDEAIRSDSGTDDITFMVETLRWKRRPSDYDPISTAREDVWARNG